MGPVVDTNSDAWKKHLSTLPETEEEGKAMDAADARKALEDEEAEKKGPPAPPSLTDNLFADVRKRNAFGLLTGSRKDSFLTGPRGIGG